MAGLEAAIEGVRMGATAGVGAARSEGDVSITGRGEGWGEAGIGAGIGAGTGGVAEAAIQADTGDGAAATDDGTQVDAGDAVVDIASSKDGGG